MRKAIQAAWRCYLLLIAFLFVAASSEAQYHIQTIQLKSGAVQPAANARQWLDSVSQVHLSNPVQVLLQFQSLPTQAQKEMLAKNGITLSDYIPGNNFIAFINPSHNAATIQSLTSITPVKPQWKTPPFLWQRINENIHNTVAVLVSFYDNTDSKTITDYMQQLSAAIIPGKMQQYGAYKITIPAEKLKTLMQWYAVRYVSPVSENVPLDKEVKATDKVNLVAQPVSLGGYGLLGDGITIGVGDNVSGIYHVDLKDRIINYNPAAMTHHGEHINGIVGGAGIIDPLAEGMAWHAQLVDHYYDNILFNTPAMRSSNNMTITNNSYVVLEGDCSYAGTYDIYAQFLDNLALQDKDVLHVFAAGNDGYLTCSPYPAGYATTCGGYQPSKNGLTVTSNDRNYVIAYDGSQGPVKDGRMKPDMCAVGVNVYSVIDITSYEFASGTSMASPEVAGAAGLLSERYKQLNSGLNPPADLLKTLLMNGATDIGNPGPDYRYGFGSLNLYRSVQMLNNGRYASNTIANAASQALSITVPANTAQLKVMLYWSDTAASPLAATALVNDLDLTVQGPSGSVHLPLVLDPAPGHVTDNAAEGADHLNNEEQVTINDPVAGNYTINVKGYNVPSASQHYVLAYDFIPQAVQLTYPAAAAQVPAQDSLHIYWDASDDTHPFMLEISTDNGANWQTIASGIPAAQRYYTWLPGNISSGQCMMRLSRNGEVSVSGTFIIASQLSPQLDSVQCPGYINIHWSPVSNAGAYQVLRKVGPYMQPIDTVSTSVYHFAGLSADSTYYVSVAPIINGLAGYRSVAVWRQPNDGTCADPVSTGDLDIERILGPASGRLLTGTALGSNETLALQVRNLYTAACTDYTISYCINGGVWQTVGGLPVIPANSTTVVNIPGLDLSAVGTYTIRAAIHNLSVADPVSQNDTAVSLVAQLDNAPVDLSTAFADGFETLDDTTLYTANVGIVSGSRWDYANTSDSGRMRTHADDSIVISGNRSVSLDAFLNMPGNQNYLTGTFNFAAYNAANTEVRCEFDYILHGEPKFIDGNQVWVRGSDSQPWVSLFNYDLNTYGVVSHSGTLSLTDAMLHNGQTYSSSFQVRFGQHDTAVIADRNYGNGITLDNIKLYTVQHDVQLVKIVTPGTADCGLGATSPLTIMIHNGVNQVQNNVQLYYKLDNGAVVSEVLPSIAAKDTVLYTFQQLMDLSANGTHQLSVWLSNAGDTYHANDSILNYTFHNQPLITSYPYLQNFETGDGYWYTEGVNDSWQYGTPASVRIHKAASGTKAWKTNLTGNYNNLEHSYLYSPCFDLSGMSSPMLSFSMAMDIENCGNTLCDGAWMEYSYDGSTWTKLGAGGQGTNWYDTTFQLWHDQGNPRWHVASIPLPQGNQPLRLRFVFNADPGANFEGLAIDDIHIFDRKADIYDGTASNTVQQTVNNQLADFKLNNQFVAQMQTNDNLGNTALSIYKQDSLSNTSKTQYIIPRSFVVKTANTPLDSVTLKLYLPDAEVLRVINDSTCLSCSKPQDAYSLGISKYDAPNTNEENGSLADNVSGTYTFFPSHAIAWVPYDQGYYAEIKVKGFSEFWFNDGGPTGDFSVADDYITFNARKINAQNVLVDWTSYIDTAVTTYWLERSYDDSSFATIAARQAAHTNVLYYSFTDTPAVAVGASVYYRLRWLMNNDSTLYSPVRKVDWTAVNTFGDIYPNPTTGDFYIKWTAHVGDQLQIAISDISGRVLYSNTARALEWNNVTAVHTAHFPVGIYFIHLRLAGKEYEKKILYY